MRDVEGGFAINSATVGDEPTPTRSPRRRALVLKAAVRNAKWSAAGAPSNFSRVRRLPLRYHALRRAGSDGTSAGLIADFERVRPRISTSDAHEAVLGAD